MSIKEANFISSSQNTINSRETLKKSITIEQLSFSLYERMKKETLLMAMIMRNKNCAQKNGPFFGYKKNLSHKLWTFFFPSQSVFRANCFSSFTNSSGLQNDLNLTLFGNKLVHLRKEGK